jgi:hypothetical protein
MTRRARFKIESADENEDKGNETNITATPVPATTTEPPPESTPAASASTILPPVTPTVSVQPAQPLAPRKPISKAEEKRRAKATKERMMKLQEARRIKREETLRRKRELEERKEEERMEKIYQRLLKNVQGQYDTHIPDASTRTRPSRTFEPDDFYSSYGATDYSSRGRSRARATVQSNYPPLEYDATDEDDEDENYYEEPPQSSSQPRRYNGYTAPQTYEMHPRPTETPVVDEYTSYMQRLKNQIFGGSR